MCGLAFNRTRIVIQIDLFLCHKLHNIKVLEKLFLCFTFTQTCFSHNFYNFVFFLTRHPLNTVVHRHICLKKNYRFFFLQRIYLNRFYCTTVKGEKEILRQKHAAGSRIRCRLGVYWGRCQRRLNPRRTQIRFLNPGKSAGNTHASPSCLPPNPRPPYKRPLSTTTRVVCCLFYFNHHR